jgi:hypothetical protein
MLKDMFDNWIQFYAFAAEIVRRSARSEARRTPLVFAPAY